MTAKSQDFDVFQFIDAVKTNRYLYDKNEEGYRDAEKRQNTWSEIAEQFQLSDGKEAYKKWKYFKDHYFAEKKKMKDRGVDENNIGDFKKWLYFDCLRWVDGFLEKRTKSGVKRPKLEAKEDSPFNVTPTMVIERSVAATLESCKTEPSPIMICTDDVPQTSLTIPEMIKKSGEKENDSCLYRSLDNVFTSVHKTFPNFSVNVVDDIGTNEEDEDCPANRQKLVHQTLVAASEEELFGRLVTRDLVRLPPNLRPLARLKIQELLYHFSTNHIPELR